MFSARYIKMLNDNGFNPIAIPRENIVPLSVLVNYGGNQVKKVGKLEDYIDDKFEPPEMDGQDLPVPFLSSQGSDKLTIDIGLDFLKKIGGIINLHPT